MNRRAPDSGTALSPDEAELAGRLAELVPRGDVLRESQILFCAGRDEASSLATQRRIRIWWLSAAVLLAVASASGAMGWQLGRSMRSNGSLAGSTAVPETADARPVEPMVGSQGHAIANTPPDASGPGRRIAAGSHRPPAPRQPGSFTRSLDSWIDELLQRHGAQPCAWPDSPAMNSGDFIPPDRSGLTQAELRRHLLESDLRQPAL